MAVTAAVQLTPFDGKSCVVFSSFFTLLYRNPAAVSGSPAGSSRHIHKVAAMAEESGV